MGTSGSALNFRLQIGLAATAVALVVTIAATLLVRTPGGVAAPLTVSLTSSGGNWTIRVVAGEPLPTEDVFFMTWTPSGDPFSPLTTLSNFSGSFIDQAPQGILSPGDLLVLPESAFPAGLAYWFLESDRLLAVGTLAPQAVSTST